MPIVPSFLDVCSPESSLSGAGKAVGSHFRMVGGRTAGPNLLVSMKNAVKSPNATPVDEDNLPTLSPSSLANRCNAPNEKAPQSLEKLDNSLDPDAFSAFLRDYLPNPKAPERLKAWIRELPYREPKQK